MLCVFCQPPQKEKKEQQEQEQELEQKELNLGRQIHNAPEIPYHTTFLWHLCGLRRDNKIILPPPPKVPHFRRGDTGVLGGLGRPLLIG